MFVALTFGDGPHPVHTPKILEILNEFKIKATFFVVGKNVEKQPSLMQRISEKGHQIGNHSFNHQLIPTLLGNYAHEVVKTQEQIEKIVGKQAKLFRSPFGASPPWVLRKITRLGYEIAPTVQATWGHDYLWWMTAGKISKRVLARVNGDSIVLLHDRGQTVEALRPIIRGLEGKNAKFVPLSEIMRNKSHRKLLYP